MIKVHQYDSWELFSEFSRVCWKLFCEIRELRQGKVISILLIYTTYNTPQKYTKGGERSFMKCEGVPEKGISGSELKVRWKIYMFLVNSKLGSSIWFSQFNRICRKLLYEAKAISQGEDMRTKLSWNIQLSGSTKLRQNKLPLNRNCK